MRPDAAESELKGEVGMKASGGAIRFRVWPARHHPGRVVVALAVVVGATVAVGFLMANAFWAAIAFVGMAFLSAAFFFPTEVAFDGPMLVIRHLGTPRSYDLRKYRRIERTSEMVPRVEVLSRARLSPMDAVDGVVVPLPDDVALAEGVMTHLRRWVGRTPTGRFKIDIDLAPEDSVEGDD